MNTKEFSEKTFISENALLREIPFCRKTLLKHRKAGKIPFIKLGHRVLYHRETVISALLRMQKGSDQAAA